MNTDNLLEGQLNIFDCFECLRTNDDNDLETMTLEHVAREITKRTGYKFEPMKVSSKEAQYLEDRYYECILAGGKLRATIDLSRFSCDGLNHKEGQRFIGVSVDLRAYSYQGASGPCYNIDEAAETLKRRIKAYLTYIDQMAQQKKKKGSVEDEDDEEGDG